jgi:peptidyl-prolyl cis-trans isomerase SurA
LQKAVEGAGVNWEDYKQQLRNNILKQKVIQQEVGSTIKIGHEEIQKYYDAHKNDFVKPEEVDLSGIFFNTENKTPQEIMQIKAKADALEKRVKAGEDFAGLARRFSEDSAASQGGELGQFKDGEMSPALEKVVFAMKKGDSSDVLEVPNGLQIFHVNQHFVAGLQPLSKVGDEIENDLYQSRIQPALRKYLTQLRKDSYVLTTAGYTDSGGSSANNVIQEVPYSPQGTKEKKKKEKAKTAAADDDQGDQNP